MTSKAECVAPFCFWDASTAHCEQCQRAFNITAAGVGGTCPLGLYTQSNHTCPSPFGPVHSYQLGNIAAMYHQQGWGSNQWSIGPIKHLVDCTGDYDELAIGLGSDMCLERPTTCDWNSSALGQPTTCALEGFKIHMEWRCPSSGAQAFPPSPWHPVCELTLLLPPLPTQSDKSRVHLGRHRE